MAKQSNEEFCADLGKRLDEQQAKILASLTLKEREVLAKLQGARPALDRLAASFGERLANIGPLDAGSVAERLVATHAPSGGPRITSGKGASKQDYATPPEFIAAVEMRYGPVVFDLAASHHNTKHKNYYSLQNGTDALSQAWNTATKKSGVLWLNPEFSDIGPWAKKCAAEAPLLPPDQAIAMLVPAAVGSNWFRDHVWGSAHVDFLNGRICFDGKNGYPKDCLLAVYRATPPSHFSSMNIWRWTEGKVW